MQTRDFCFWLQGLLEVGRVTQLDAEQTAMVKQHLALVFQHDPTITGVEHEPAEKPQDVTAAVRSILERSGATRPPRARWDNPRTVLLC